MRSRALPKVMKALLLVSAAALFGSSPYPGGCGSKVQKAQPYASTVDMSCDTIVNGKSSCANSTSSGGTSSGGPSDSNSYSPSPYCSDPAYPLDCGTGMCCPSGFPYCCADSQWCGTDSSACEQVVDNPTKNSSSGSSGSASGGTGATQCSTYGQGNKCSIQACASASSDGSCSAWYNASTGQQFQCNSCTDCYSAAQQVVTFCQ